MDDAHRHCRVAVKTAEHVIPNWQATNHTRQNYNDYTIPTAEHTVAGPQQLHADTEAHLVTNIALAACPQERRKASY